MRAYRLIKRLTLIGFLFAGCFSPVAHAAETYDTVVLNFDSVSAVPADVGAETYLAAAGIKVQDRTWGVPAGTPLVIVNADKKYASKIVLTSPPNVLAQRAKEGEILYRLIFDNPCDSVKFTRPKIMAGVSFLFTVSNHWTTEPENELAVNGVLR